MIYLDYAASSPVKEAAIKVLMESTVNDFANPASSHKLGLDLSRRIDVIREKILHLLFIKRGYRVVFLSSATEANNLVIRGLSLKNGDQVLLSLADHPSLKAPAYQLLKDGVEVLPISHDLKGVIDEKWFQEKTFPKAKLLAISHVNNQSGHIFPIEKISKVIKALNKNLHIHIDGVQAVSKIPVNFSDMSIDSLTISGHKLGGPKGIAALIVKENIKLSPQMLGGGQEYNFRSSTLCAPLIFAFYEALLDAINNQKKVDLKLSTLKDYLMSHLPKECPEVIFPFDGCTTSNHIVMMIFPKVSSDILIRHLEMKEIYLSSTSACSSKGKVGDNEVFTHLNINVQYHQNVLRLSMGEKTTQEEIEIFIREISTIYRELRAFK